MAERIDTLKEEPELGGIYAVPCFVIYLSKEFEKEWNGTTFVSTGRNRTFLIPVHNHPHSDKENGQHEIHYHVDKRFDIPHGVENIELADKYTFWRRIEKDKYLQNFAKCFPDRVVDKYISSSKKIKYFDLACVRFKETTSTPASFIKNSKLKHKCIHKGKCPHRGYDLSTAPVINGVITCPLHSLKFDAATKKVLRNANDEIIYY